MLHSAAVSRAHEQPWHRLPTSMPQPAPATPELLQWPEAEQARSARWHSERGAPPPRRVVLADDTLPADTAYRLANEGTALLWRGDFQNARHLLQALARRADKPRRRPAKAAPENDPAAAFHLHRQAQAQRARVLGSVLIELQGDYGIAPAARARLARRHCRSLGRAARHGGRDFGGVAARTAGPGQCA
jgi:hypothetical protein